MENGVFMSYSQPVEHAAATPPVKEHAPGGSIYLSFGSWVLFTVLAEHGTLKAAAIASLVIAIGVTLYSTRGGGSLKMLDIAAIATFIAFTILAFVGDQSLTHFLTRYARAIAAALLAILVFGSLLVTPFTEQYARERVSKQYWGSPEFKAVNRKLTLVWGGVFAVMTCSHVIAGAIDRPITNIVFNWVVPIYLVLHASKAAPKAASGAKT
jgi:hypothetical protein